jgi:hypothetical protein
LLLSDRNLRRSRDHFPQLVVLVHNILALLLQSRGAFDYLYSARNARAIELLIASLEQIANASVAENDESNYLFSEQNFSSNFHPYLILGENVLNCVYLLAHNSKHLGFAAVLEGRGAKTDDNRL